MSQVTDKLMPPVRCGRPGLLWLSILAFVFACAIPVAGQIEPAKNEAPTALLLREPPAPPSCTQQSGKLINMLVIGDSILWGQGLKEEHKISYRVQDWLCTQTHRPVKLWREAHSGAVLQVGEPIEAAAAVNPGANEPKVATTSSEKEIGGEVNVDDPTIPAQLDHALKHFQGPEQVDLVLMDGCINDFNIRNLLDASMPTRKVDERARAVCYDRMKPFLDEAAKALPNARFIVTGYYPVMTQKSAKNVLLRLVLRWGFAKEKRKWLFQNVRRVSTEFGDYSNGYLQKSVNDANGTSNRIIYVPVYYKPDSRFGSPGSGFAAPKKTALLWTTLFNSTGRGGLSKFFYVLFKLNFHALRPNDEVYSDRKIVCKDAELPLSQRLSCRVAAFGHPNRMGVDEYVERVTIELRRMIGTSDWLKVHQ